MRPGCVDNAVIQVERAGRTDTPMAQSIRCVFHVREQKVQQRQKLIHQRERKKKKDPAPFYFSSLAFPLPLPPSSCAFVRRLAAQMRATPVLSVSIVNILEQPSAGGARIISLSHPGKALEEARLVYKARV